MTEHLGVGHTFPDLVLPDHAGNERRLSELAANDTAREIWVEVPEQPDEIEVELDVDVVELKEEQGRSTADLIAAGESKVVEFKQTARFNAHTAQPDKNLEHAVVKSIAGFLNASGGVLLIGVHDEQRPTGLEGDYATTGNRGRDGFENWLVTKLERELGRPPVASFVNVSFDAFPGGDVCRVDVKPSDKPVYVGGSAEFFVRMGNSTRPYNIATHSSTSVPGGSRPPSQPRSATQPLRTLKAVSRGA